MSNILTPGQKRIREIIYKYLPEYRRLDKLNKVNYSFYINIQNEFSNDPIITSDTCINQSLFNVRISKNYLKWLENTGIEERIHFGEYSVELNKFFYDPSSSHKMLAYKGGYRFNSTYWSLFQFAEGIELPRHTWSSTFYVNEGILKVASGGSHRLLAHVLWGEHIIKPDEIILYKKSPTDPKLHSNLLGIEAFLGSCKLYFVLEDCSKSEIDKVKRFIINVNTSEIKTVKSFLNSKYRKYIDSYFSLNSLDRGEKKHITINDLEKVFGELKTIKSRSLLKKIVLWIAIKFNFYKDRISIFEQWLIENQLSD
jgi:hypothetical protein